MDDLQKLIGIWGDRTFPSHARTGPKGPIYHLREEVDELVYEYQTDGDWQLEVADAAILLFTIAHLAHFSLYEVVQGKMVLNLARKWGEADANGIVHHVKVESDT